jgi:fatty-acyl-CoA synthase/long-chain acyl-CoA synthetase
LNPVLRASELTYALTHSRAKVLIHADRSRDYDMAAVAVEVRNACPDLHTVISLSDRDQWEAVAPAGDRSPTDPDLPVMLQFTSGTTGKPKGVLLRHRSLVNVAKLTLEAAGVPTAAVAINPLPMFHTAGCVVSTLGPLWTGGTVVLIETFDPVAVLDAMRAEGVTVLYFVPAILGALLAAQSQSSQPAPSLTTILGGASTVSATMIEAAEQAFGASVTNLFGQTELGPTLTATRPTDPRALQLATVGRPLPQVDCAILDPTTGAVAPLGMAGEICARGYQVMSQYLHDPDATARAVDANGFLHTGDLGSMDSDGYLTLTGRLKELIIRGGENISPAEIESCLLDHAEVADAAVVGVPDDHWGEIVVAVVHSTTDEPAGLADRLREHCRERLSPHKIPVQWHHLDALPITPTGKVQKYRVVELIDQGATTQLS